MRSKYHNQPTIKLGKVFDSRKEAGMYQTLQILEKCGKIKDLLLQPKFRLQEGYMLNGKKIREINYIADFMFYDNENQKTRVIDCKGYRGIEVYRIKRKIFDYINLERGIFIEEEL
ncbi:MAG: DUF1064 domain-containing protein [Actinomycetota bacterium]